MILAEMYRYGQGTHLKYTIHWNKEDKEVAIEMRVSSLPGGFGDAEPDVVCFPQELLLDAAFKLKIELAS